MTMLHDTRPTRGRAGLLRIAMALLCGVLMVAAAGAPAGAESPLANTSGGGPTVVTVPLVARDYSTSDWDLGFFGVGAPVPFGLGPDPVSLGVEWYWDWQAAPDAATPDGIAYVPTIRLTQTGATTYTFSPNLATLVEVAQSHPGTVWFVGNEPDRMDVQDDLEPQVYARAYHDLYTLIKNLDPTALVAAGHIVQPTPLRLRYLDAVLAEYQAVYGTRMPVDVWAIHAYAINEGCDCILCPDMEGCETCELWGASIPPGIPVTDPDDLFRIAATDTVETADPETFRGFVRTFRQWMASRGYRQCPLVISESGLLLPEDLYRDNGRSLEFNPPNNEVEQLLLTYLQETMDYARTATDTATGLPSDDYRLVQAVAWYATSEDDSGGYAAASLLYDYHSGERTVVGDAFAAYTAAAGD